MADPSLGIQTVQFGEAVTMRDGSDGIADHDLVLVYMIKDDEEGRPLFQLTPEQAIILGRELTKAAVKLMNSQVGDDGKPTTLAHRISILNQKRHP